MTDQIKRVCSENELQSSGRRKAIKNIVVGVGALTAYHVMPTNWSKPIIEQVFLPAHAATSGEVVVPSCCIIRLVNDSSVDISVSYTVCSSGVSMTVTFPGGGTTADISVPEESAFAINPSSSDPFTYMNTGAATGLNAGFTNLDGNLDAGAAGSIRVTDGA